MCIHQDTFFSNRSVIATMMYIHSEPASLVTTITNTQLWHSLDLNRPYPPGISDLPCNSSLPSSTCFHFALNSPSLLLPMLTPSSSFVSFDATSHDRTRTRFLLQSRLKATPLSPSFHDQCTAREQRRSCCLNSTDTSATGRPRGA